MAALRMISSATRVTARACNGARQTVSRVATPAARGPIRSVGTSGAWGFRSAMTPAPMTAGVRRGSDIACAAAAEEGDVVKVNYTGTLDDGQVFDTSLQEGREPLEFEVGAGTVVKGFDKCVTGLEVGETRKMRIEPEDAYGQRNPDNMASFPKESAPEGLKEGDAVQLSNGMRAVVVEVNDKEVTIDANHPLAGMPLTFEVTLMDLTKGTAFEEALFGAGCFWGVELNFQRQIGVARTTVGYAQGKTESPTYEEVCNGTTNHNEVVRVKYDPSEISFQDLCAAFFSFHDPTTLNRQGGDQGTQYRSGIYYNSDEQKAAAEAAKEAAAGNFSDPIVTEIEPASTFWDAESYHQQYLARGGRNGNAQDPSKGCTDPVRCYG